MPREYTITELKELIVQAKAGDQESFAQAQKQASDFSQDRSLPEDVPIVDLADDNVPPDENIPF